MKAREEIKTCWQREWAENDCKWQWTKIMIGNVSEWARRGMTDVNIAEK